MSDAVSKSDQEKLVQDQTAPPATEAAVAPTTAQNGGEAKAMDVDGKEKPQEGATPSEGEADVTKEGKPAEVGEKRERPEDDKEEEAKLAETEKDAGKEAKKAKTDGAEAAVDAAEPLAEGAAPTNGEAAADKPAKRGPGRPPKGKAAAAATAEGGEPKKRGPGRPRKGTNPTKEGEEANGNDAEPATTGTRRSTRSRG
ncbi:hypothetical protein D9619_011342 [Psilocybe cf. subviscida]|uniref:Uncharacterized protein n=1 Tax=Psilocybe cf. subviscida TaxID=2480587 RepID=A0A8H5F555_9AGAR|nr:hypothetical protein D9619_011342 [Psilocybe cf. subviscida]